MSLYALWMRTPKASEAEIEEALQGNLCRCTGYQPIIAAAKAAGDASPANDPLLAERARVRAALDALDDGARVDIRTGDDRVVIPASVADLAAVLAELPKPTIVAGSTDVGLWITKFMRNISPAVFVNNLADLQAIEVGPDARHHRRRRHLRRLPDDPRRRVPAPLGLLAPHRRLAGPRDGHRRRQHRQRLADRRHAPGADRARRHRHAPQRRRPAHPAARGLLHRLRQAGPASLGEFVESITIPRPAAGTLNAAYKITKRRDEDISAVAVGFHVAVENGTVTTARLAFGGMAATPKRAATVEAALVGKPWTLETIVARRAGLRRGLHPAHRLARQRRLPRAASPATCCAASTSNPPAKPPS